MMRLAPWASIAGLLMAACAHSGEGLVLSPKEQQEAWLGWINSQIEKSDAVTVGPSVAEWMPARCERKLDAQTIVCRARYRQGGRWHKSYDHYRPSGNGAWVLLGSTGR